jgi:hypothetical protein
VAASASALHESAPLPTVTLDDNADRDLLSKLTFDQAKELKHADVICKLSVTEVRRWRVGTMSANAATQTFTVCLHEWPRITITVSANRLHRHSSIAPSV